MNAFSARERRGGVGHAPQHLLVSRTDTCLSRGVDRHDLCAVLGLLRGEAENAVLMSDKAHLMCVDGQLRDQRRPCLRCRVIDLDAAIRCARLRALAATRAAEQDKASVDREGLARDAHGRRALEGLPGARGEREREAIRDGGEAVAHAAHHVVAAVEHSTREGATCSGHHRAGDLLAGAEGRCGALLLQRRVVDGAAKHTVQMHELRVLGARLVIVESAEYPERVLRIGRAELRAWPWQCVLHRLPCGGAVSDHEGIGVGA